MMQHGGDTVSFTRAYGVEPLDFSMNVNPYGMPEGVLRAAQKALKTADRYPDPLCRALNESLSAARGVPPGWIRCGNGAADLIFRIALAQRPRRALVLSPTFSEYEQALRAAGCAVVRHALCPENGFLPTASVLDALAPGIDIFFLCNPNNPTGLLIEPGLLGNIVARCAHSGIRLVVDECFLGFTQDPPGHSVKRYMQSGSGVVLLDAFTKLYAMAGLRLGYVLCADEAFLAKLDAAGQPWAVSSVAQAAGIAALAQEEYVAQSLAMIRREKEYLLEGLRAAGMQTIGFDANYIFFRGTEAGLAERLREKGILIRSCANFEGLDDAYFRIAVRTHSENERLLVAMRDGR